ncbi:MAG: hypothetical protein CMK00_08535 [Planctomycetes bacterium]|nr:hypothetical protein [Planctomycetota bacterium]
MARAAFFVDNRSMQRTSVLCLSFVLTILFAWLLEFCLSDIGQLEGPNLQELRAQIVPAQLQEQRDAIATELETTEQEISSQQED